MFWRSCRCPKQLYFFLVWREYNFFPILTAGSTCLSERPQAMYQTKQAQSMEKKLQTTIILAVSSILDWPEHLQVSTHSLRELFEYKKCYLYLFVFQQPYPVRNLGRQLRSLSLVSEKSRIIDGYIWISN